MPLRVDDNTELTAAQIQEKIDRYSSYIQSKVPSDQTIYLSNVIEKKDLLTMLEADCYGVRVMLVKEGTGDQQEGIGMFVVSVKKEVIPPAQEGDEEKPIFINQLGNTDKFIYEECPSKYCN